MKRYILWFYFCWIEPSAQRLRLFVLNTICRFKGHVREYWKEDPDGKYPFCSRCLKALPVVLNELYINPYLDKDLC